MERFCWRKPSGSEDTIVEACKTLPHEKRLFIQERFQISFGMEPSGTSARYQ